MPCEPDDTDRGSVSLLVRRIGPDAVGRGPDMLSSALHPFAAAGGLFVLADLAWDPTRQPLAVAAFSLDRPSRRARLQAVVVAGPHRRRGLGSRLLTGAGVVLSADGFEIIEAEAGPGDPTRRLLRRIGFEEVEGSKLLYRL